MAILTPHETHGIKYGLTILRDRFFIEYISNLNIYYNKYKLTKQGKELSDYIFCEIMLKQKIIDIIYSIKCISKICGIESELQTAFLACKISTEKYIKNTHKNDITKYIIGELKCLNI